MQQFAVVSSHGLQILVEWMLSRAREKDASLFMRHFSLPFVTQPDCGWVFFAIKRLCWIPFWKGSYAQKRRRKINTETNRQLWSIRKDDINDLPLFFSCYFDACLCKLPLFGWHRNSAFQSRIIFSTANIWKLFFLAIRTYQWNQSCMSTALSQSVETKLFVTRIFPDERYVFSIVISIQNESIRVVNDNLCIVI